MPYSCRRVPRMRAGAWVLVFALCAPAPVLGQAATQLPLNGQVVHGQASISSPSASQLLIHQASQRAIIDWGEFSIGPDGVVRVLQPGADAALLNRVVGDHPSVIDGLLQANGQIYLLNQRGILVGPGGVIDTAAFLGSILNVSDSAFLAGGPMAFSGTADAGIVNLGVIRASTGDVALIAPTIVNKGTITAPAGTAALASGREVLLASGGEGSLIVKAALPATTATAIDNQGLVEAAEVQIAAAGSPYALAVNNAGRISATSVTSSGGRIRLEAGDGGVGNSGVIEARGAELGGRIDLFGRDITLAAGSRIDASGENGGGAVRIGGGANGRDESAPHAETVTVDRGATIAANALSLGNGGSVVIWSDFLTRYAGLIEALGGAAGGNGGNAEVSGGRLVYDGRADLRAPSGLVGTLLLDPADIDIDAQMAGALAATLNTASVTQQATNSIVVSAAITNATTTRTLTLNAPSISINAGISLPMGDLNLINSTGVGVSVLGALGASIDVDHLVLAGNHATTTFSGPVTADRVSVDKAGAATGHIAIDNAANAIGELDFLGLDNTFTAGDIKVRSSTAMTVSGILETGGTVDIRADGSLTMASGSAIKTPSTVTLTAAGSGSAFINQSAGLITGTGRVVIYSNTDGNGYTAGGLGYPLHFGVAPGSDPQTGNVIYIATGGVLPTLVITADDKTKVYGSPTPAFTASFTGGSAADLTAPVQFSVSGAHVNVGTYTIVPFGATSATHQISFVNGTLTITPAPLVITTADASKTYGSSLPSFRALFDGFVNGDDESVISGLQFTTTATAASGVGTYAIVPTGASASNYTITYANGTLTVNPAKLTVSAATTRRLYGGTNPVFTPLIAGLVNGDTADVVSGLTFSTDAGVTSPVGIYSVMVAGGAALNYTFDYIPGTLFIDPAPLTITAQPAQFVYGAPVPAAFANVFTGLVAGDTPSSAGFASLADVRQGSNAGAYQTQLFGSNANYVVTYVPALITIAPAPLIIVANSFSRPYGTANPAFTATISGLIGDDTVPDLSFTTEATLWSPSGSYAIVPSSGAMPNYDVTYVPGVLAVDDPAVLTTIKIPEGVFDTTKPALEIALPDLSVRVSNLSDTSMSSLFDRAPSIVERALSKLDAKSEAEYPSWVQMRRNLARAGLEQDDPIWVGTMLPLLIVEASAIFQRPESTWTSEERSFLEYLRSVIEAERRKAAEDAMAAYEQWRADNRAAQSGTLAGLMAIDQVPPATFLEQASGGVSVTDEQALRMTQMSTAAAGTAAAAAATQAVPVALLKAISIKASTITTTYVNAAVAAVGHAMPEGASLAATTAAKEAAKVTATKAAAGTLKGMSAIAGVGVGVAVVAITLAVSAGITVANAGEYDVKIKAAHAAAQQPVTLEGLRSMLSSESGAQQVFTYLSATAAGWGGH